MEDDPAPGKWMRSRRTLHRQRFSMDMERSKRDEEACEDGHLPKKERDGDAGLLKQRQSFDAFVWRPASVLESKPPASPSRRVLTDGLSAAGASARSLVPSHQLRMFLSTHHPGTKSPGRASGDGGRIVAARKRERSQSSPV